MESDEKLVEAGIEMKRENVGNYSPSSGAILAGILRRVVVNHSFVVIAAQWPGWMVTLIALDLPIKGAYFPTAYHRYFKSKASVCTWNSPVDLLHATADNNVIYLVSGTVQFIQKIRPWLTDSVAQRSIVSLEVHLRGSSRSVLTKARVEGKKLLHNMGLKLVDFVDNKCGGATDAVHWFGFGSNLGSKIIPRPEPGLPLCVRHFIDGGVDLSVVRHQLVPLSVYQLVENPRRLVLWDGNVLRSDGLLPCSNPNATLYCTAYENPRSWVVRALTLLELLRIYQLPLSMNGLFAESLDMTSSRIDRVADRVCKGVQEVLLPFENAPSSTILTSIIRQLWGDVGGVQAIEAGDLVGKSHNIQDEKVENVGMQDRTVKVENAQASVMTVKRLDTLLRDGSPIQAGDSDDVHVDRLESVGRPGLMSVVSEALVELGKEDRICVEEGYRLCGATEPAQDFEHGEEPTSFDGKEGARGEEDQIYESPSAGKVEGSRCHIKLGAFPKWKGSAQDSDDGSVSSLASEETSRWRHTRCRRDEVDPELEMEKGPPIQFEPGPPFSIGAKVMCDAEGIGKRVGLVMRADHPNYTICLENGDMVHTATMSTVVMPWYAEWEGNTNGLSPYVEPPLFAKLRREMSQVGSFGAYIDAQLMALQAVDEAKAYAKAVKSDDAGIPVELWNDRIPLVGVSSKVLYSALAALRKLGWLWYMKVRLRDCVRYMKAQHGKNWVSKPRKSKEGITELGKDQLSLTSMLWHDSQSDWFEYHGGSKLAHFRFPGRYRKIARDGVPIFFEQSGPNSKGMQPHIVDSRLRERTREKVSKVLGRKYLLPPSSPIKSYIKYFAVPKGEDDVRLVYDATANGLNESAWILPFWLPTIDTLVRGVDEKSWMTDRDMGDMFLNFQLHASAVAFTGVDLTPLYDDPSEVGPRSAVWDRNLMGFAPSPYNCVKMALIVEEIIKGDRRLSDKGIDGRDANPFQWETVHCNLPGTKDYDPNVSWLTKRRKDGLIACDVFTFVDDERVTGPTEELTWQAAHTLASKQSYLGIQDAARKVRPCSRTPGAWAGSVVHISPVLGVCVLTSREKWTKMRGILLKWRKALVVCSPQLSHKELLSDRGFLVYVTRTYPAMVPYLKGFHLTIEMWRGGRDSEGWKMKGADAGLVDSLVTTQDGDDNYLTGAHKWLGLASVVHAPSDGLTTPAPRFVSDVEALLQLSKFDLPPLRVVRPSMVVHVYYGFGDASGKQFGATISDNYNRKSNSVLINEEHHDVRFRVGIWSAYEEEESSNFKELCNLVQTLTTEARAGRLKNCEMFLFTDNSTAESCFYNGTSKSKLLHSLVLSLRLLEMEFGMSLYVIHISGKRMIAQGTDGCSRGSLMEGVMAGEEMLKFVDLGRSAIDRHPPLLDWVRAWSGRPYLMPLSPEGWFDEGHGIVGGYLDHNGVWMPTYGKGGRMFLWVPPPAVADVALEELLKARHKRTDTFHVLLIPRLMNPRWRRLFHKACDLSFVVSPGSNVWPTEMFEPLWVGLLLPFVKHRPWCLKRAPLLLEIGRNLRSVLAAGEGNEGDILRKLTLLPRRVDSLPFDLACGVLHMPRSGDNELSNS